MMARTPDRGELHDEQLFIISESLIASRVVSEFIIVVGIIQY